MYSEGYYNETMEYDAIPDGYKRLMAHLGNNNIYHFLKGMSCESDFESYVHATKISPAMFDTVVKTIPKLLRKEHNPHIPIAIHA